LGDRGYKWNTGDLLDALKARSEALNRLHRIQTSRHGDLKALAELVLDAATSILDMGTGMVGRLDNEQYDIYASRSAHGMDLTATMPLADTLCREVIGKGGTVAVADLQLADVQSSALERMPLRFRSWVSAPVRVANELHGTLALMSTRTRSRGFAPHEIEIVEMMANSIGRFVELARSEDEREATAASLNESESRARTVLENVVDGIITIDDNGIIRTINPAVTRLFGYSEADLIGRNVSYLMPEPYRSAHDGYLARYLRTGESRIIGIGREVRAQRADGSVFPIDLAVGAMEMAGQRMFTGIIRDISERKEVERLKSEFISVVSHELRTPIAALHGSLGLLEASIGEEVKPETLRLLDIGRRNTSRLINLVNDIVDLERLDSGLLALDLAPVSATDLLDAAIAEANEQAGKRNVTMRVIASEGAVHGDRRRLLQVLRHLLSNALKFSSDGQAVELSARMAGDKVRFEFRDRGPGVPESARETLFYRFQQGDSSTGRAKGGTGLGLSISMALVQRHGGQLGLIDPPDGGALFWFELPSATA